MTARQAVELIADALRPVPLDVSTADGKRVLVAYLAARIAQGADGAIERRLADLRRELGI